METLNKQTTILSSNILDIDNSKKLINVERQKIKDNSSRALSAVLSIITDSANYNKETDKTVTGTIYEGQNHAYFKVNKVLQGFDDLEKSTEKTIDAILKVLLVSDKIDFSLFVTTLKDLELYASNSHLLTSEDLVNNEVFEAKIAVISQFFAFVKLYRDNKLSKAYRKILGGYEVKINGKEANFIEVLRDYKINKSISLDDFNALNEAYISASKAYYKSLNTED